MQSETCFTQGETLALLQNNIGNDASAGAGAGDGEAVCDQRYRELNTGVLVGLCSYAIHMLPKMGYKCWRCKNAMGMAIRYGFR